MACMTHICYNPQCDWTTMDNQPRWICCPWCGGEIRSYFDESLNINSEDEESFTI